MVQELEFDNVPPALRRKQIDSRGRERPEECGETDGECQKRVTSNPFQGQGYACCPPHKQETEHHHQEEVDSRCDVQVHPYSDKEECRDILILQEKIHGKE